MKLKLVRETYGPNFTSGKLFVDGVHFGETLEDARRVKKVPKHTCIPSGVYEIETRLSPSFNRRMLWLKGVPGFTYVYFHGGNTHEDTEGCILIGRHRVDEGGIYGSLERQLFTLVVKALARGDKVFLCVEDTGEWKAKTEWSWE